MARNTVPVIVKHMTVAIMKKGYSFDVALEIARARLMEWGYLHRGADQGDANSIRLTSKGVKKNQTHLRESGGLRKSMTFDKLFESVQQPEPAGKTIVGDKGT